MEPIKIAVIGVGNMGSFHLNNITQQPKLKLAAVCDIIPERAQAAAEAFGAKAYSDSEILLSERICEAVIVATPHYAHTTIGVSALQQGYHLLVEKPISVHKADCERLIAAHTDKNLVFEAMFQMRTDPHYQKIRQMVKDGELGDLVRINWIITDWFRPESYYASGGWRATWKGEGGGVLLNQCPHNLDQMWWIFGMPERVHGNCGLGWWHNIEVEDQVTAYLEYPNHCTGVFVTSTGEAPGSNRLEVAGDKGKLVFENGKLTFYRNLTPTSVFTRTTDGMFTRPDLEEIDIVVEGYGGQHAEVLENFCDAIRDGAKLIAPAEEGIHSVELANAMLQSSLTNQPAEIPLDGCAYEKLLMGLIERSTFEKKSADAVEQDMTRSFH
jgi:predicted dehydrogenase